MTEKARRLRSHLRAATEADAAAASVLPDDCPVRPLGKEGEGCWYMDALGQLRFLKARDHSRNNLAHLFAPFVEYLTHVPAWCRYDKEGELKGFRPEVVADQLMKEAGRLGVWNPYAKVRGVGAWSGEDGDLVLHLGRRLWINGRTERPGMRGDFVYPVAPERPGPHPDPQPGGEHGPARELLAMLRTWRFERPELDPLLLLGWVCASMLGGALDWRPACWLTGDRGTGKSTLQELIKRLFVDGEGILTSSDPTAAGVRQRQGYNSTPVAFDELEAEEDNARVNALIGLARQAASGGTILRGGADHTGQDFIARFAVLYSSILIPPLRPADLSRIAVLNLQPLQGGKPPLLRNAELRVLGQRLLRRMADRWQEWPARYDAWREPLLALGYDSRGADQFGTLLAAADLALHDHPPDSDSLQDITAELASTAAADRAEEMPDWARCLQHITTSLAQQWRGGEQRTVGTLVAIAANRAVLRDPTTQEPGPVRPAREQRQEAQDALATYGLRVEIARKVDGSPELDAEGEWEGALAVANAHAQLNELFRGTHWAGRSGAAGVWRQTLARVPGAMRGAPLKFRGTTQRAVLVPLRFALHGFNPET